MLTVIEARREQIMGSLLLDVQRRLNGLLGFDHSDSTLNMRVYTAFLSEVGEATQALKPVWAWWRKHGDHELAKEITPEIREAVAEELVDVLFFFMTGVHQVATQQRKSVFDLGEPNLARMMDETLSLTRQEYDEITGNMVDSLLTNYGHDAILACLLRLARDGAVYTAEDDEITEIFMNVVSGLTLLGVSPDEIPVRYLRKARANVRRWLEAGLVKDLEQANSLLAYIEELLQRSSGGMMA